MAPSVVANSRATAWRRRRTLVRLSLKAVAGERSTSVDDFFHVRFALLPTADLHH